MVIRKHGPPDWNPPAKAHLDDLLTDTPEIRERALCINAHYTNARTMEALGWREMQALFDIHHGGLHAKDQSEHHQER